MVWNLVAAAAPALVGNIFGGRDNNRPAPNIERIGPSYQETGMAKRWQQLTDDSIVNYLKELNDFKRRFRTPDEMNPVEQRRLKELEDQLKFYSYVQDPERARHDFFLQKQDYDQAKSQFEREVGPLLGMREEKQSRLNQIKENKQKALQHVQNAYNFFQNDNNAQSTIEALGRYLQSGAKKTFNEWATQNGINPNNVDILSNLDKGIYTYGNGIPTLSGTLEKHAHTARANKKAFPYINQWKALISKPDEEQFKDELKEIKGLEQEIEKRSEPYLPVVQQYKTWQDKLPLIDEVHQAKRLEAEQRNLEDLSLQDPFNRFFESNRIPVEARDKVATFLDLGKQLKDSKLKVYAEQVKQGEYEKAFARLQNEYTANPTPIKLRELQDLKALRDRELLNIKPLEDQTAFLTQQFQKLYPQVSSFLPNNNEEIGRLTDDFVHAQNAVFEGRGALTPEERQKLDSIKDQIAQHRKNPQVDTILGSLPPPEIFREKVENLKRQYETVAPMSESQMAAGDTYRTLQSQAPEMYQDLERDLDTLTRRELLNEKDLSNIDRLSRDLYSRDNRPMYGELQKMAQGDFDRLKYTIPGIFGSAGARNTAARVAADQALRSAMQSRAQSALTRFEHEEGKDRLDQGMRLEQLRGNLKGLTSDRLRNLYGERKGTRDQYFQTMKPLADARYKFGEQQQQLRQAENAYRMEKHNVKQGLPVQVAQSGLQAVASTAPLAPQYISSLASPNPAVMETAGSAPNPSNYAFNAVSQMLGNGGGGGSATPAIGYAQGGRTYPSLQTLKDEVEDDPYKNEYIEAIRNLQNITADKPERWMDTTKRFGQNLLDYESSGKALADAQRETDKLFEAYKDKDTVRNVQVGSMYETLNDSKRKTMDFLERFHHNKVTAEESAIGHDITDRHNRAYEEIQRENNALMNDLHREKFESVDAKRQADIERDTRKLDLQEEKAQKDYELKEMKERNSSQKLSRADGTFAMGIIERHKIYPKTLETLGEAYKIASKLNSGGFGTYSTETPLGRALAGVGRQADIEVFEKAGVDLTNAALTKIGGGARGVGFFKEEKKGVPGPDLTAEANLRLIRERGVDLVMQKYLDDAISVVSSKTGKSPLKIALEIAPEWEKYGAKIHSYVKKNNLDYTQAIDFVNQSFEEFRKAYEDGSDEENVSNLDNDFEPATDSYIRPSQDNELEESRKAYEELERLKKEGLIPND